MECDALKKIITRACEFSKKDDLAQNCVFKVKNGTLEIRASNGTVGICITSNLGIDLKDLECAVNIYALQATLKAFENDADLDIKIKKNKLMIESDIDKAALPIMDVETVFYIPKPQNWIKAPDYFAEKIATVRGMHFKTIKGMDKDIDDLIIIKGKDICQLSRSVYVFEETETEINISVSARYLQRISNNIDAFCVENNRIYFKNENEWTMISGDSRVPPKYEVLFTEVQKLNNSVIRINSDTFLAFCEKLNAQKSAEDLSTFQPNHSIKLEFEGEILHGITGIGSTQIKIENNTENIKFAVVADFIKSISSKLFLKEDFVELHVGKNMRFVMATCGTTKIMGVLCRV